MTDILDEERLILLLVERIESKLTKLPFHQVQYHESQALHEKAKRERAEKEIDTITKRYMIA